MTIQTSEKENNIISNEVQNLKKNADKEIILDFMRQISTLTNRNIMIQKSLEFFFTLTSPKKIKYYDIIDKSQITCYMFEDFEFSHSKSVLPRNLPSSKQLFLWDTTQTMVILQIKLNYECIGYLLLADFQQPQYADQYIHLLLQISKYWGYFFNDVSLNQLMKTMRQIFSDFKL
ncbi:hypothetical protein NEF87_001969 [Candidatus Lokiarchaeum ossiferum]|uniref:Uncharacterized protein n=1 Tax=Candidatus Lokiarchaeum ossiferum TaxID=2951803 RepID=A0ABY6HQ97_9ARCH|nr:hypothetical protein NEF87_001969 [Candidatus Lokiarchaeum sp. B-35]